MINDTNFIEYIIAVPQKCGFIVGSELILC